MGADSGCDTSLPCVGECKDDNTLLTQIAFTILLVYSFYLLWRNIRNLLHLRDQRKKIRVHKLLIINLVIFVFLISNIILYADGFVSLFTKNGFLNFEAFNIVEEFTPCSQQIAFAIGYYNWSALFATVYDKPKQTVRRIAMGISALFILIFVLFYAFFCIYFSAVGIKHDGQADFSASPGFQAILEGFSAAILLNTSLFVVACGMLIKKLKTIYYFSSDKSARKMRNLLICTIFALILRVIVDVGLSFLTPFADLKCQISVQGDNAHTGDRIAWAIYMLGFFMICNLFPVTFLIINFSPVMTKNATSSQSQDSEFNPSSGKKILLRGDGSSDLIR